MTTDTSERALEDIIVLAMTGRTNLASPYDPAATPALAAGGTGWILGDPRHYEREFAVDVVQLGAFIAATQPEAAAALDLGTDGPVRRQFLARLQGEITKRGIVDVLRTGIKHGNRVESREIDLFYGTPTPGNQTAERNHACNRFVLVRQLRYSRDQTRRALDLALFVNGLAVATFELKNRLTKQTVADAVEQYQRDREPTELLFQLGRCIAHFAVDDLEVKFCAELCGKDSWFLPFNKGWNDGAGNPPNPNGLRTAFLWQASLTPASLTDILEHYAQLVELIDPKTKRKSYRQIFPRYHQLDVVRRILADAAVHGAGRRYLIQHSAGSGKSNSIAWLALQLVSLRKDDRDVFDSILVVTDRRILDDQIHRTIKGFKQVGATIGHADRAGQLRSFIEGGKKVIITTLQKFPHVVKEIGTAHRDRTFAILIDEAHSSQGGKTAAALAESLAEGGAAVEDESPEDRLNRWMDARKMLPNASYFAFTATPKNKTLEIFGEPCPADNVVPHRPFHSYTMKQAIDENFILDVLQNYTPVESYYKLVPKIDADPEFDKKRAQKKLRHYVESHPHAIRIKSEIMVDHFHQQVDAPLLIGRQARAMVVTSGVERAIQYFHAFRTYLTARKSPYKAIVAFSGEHEYEGAKVTEATLNGFASKDIVDRIVEEPYRFLICADKFQTGYDEPLLHTMYVDKVLGGIQAVQTLSRLNRAHRKKHNTFVLDFINDGDAIRESFQNYYRTTVLSSETDPNKLHDLKSALDAHEVYGAAEIDEFVTLFLSAAPRDRLDPILDRCQAQYVENLDEDAQVDFKGKAKAFLRTYSFLSSILPYRTLEWEKLSILLNCLIDKLPAPKEDDLTKGMLEKIDMDSYRAEKRATVALAMADQEAEIDPVPVDGGGGKRVPELERLSLILKAFNEMWGNLDWQDRDRLNRMIQEEIPRRVSADPAYTNARAQGDKANARFEHDAALQRVIISMLRDDTSLYKHFNENREFARSLSDLVFKLTYEAGV